MGDKPVRRTYKLSGTDYYSINSTYEEVCKNSVDYKCSFYAVHMITPSMFINCIMDQRTLESLKCLEVEEDVKKTL